MSVGNLKDQGNKGNNFPYQLKTLQLLDAINQSISALPGVDYETRTTTYQATAPGTGYSTGDFIVRYDIIDVATSTISSTVWFNQTTQTAISAPNPADLTPITPPTGTTVLNGAGAAAVNIQDGGNSITVDGTVNIGNFPATQNVAVTSIVEVEVKNDSGNPLPISGTVTITDGSGPVTIDGTVAATQSGTWNINNISGTISLPTGAATESTLSTLNTKVPSNLTVSSTRLLVDGSGVTQPVSGTITANAGTGNFTVVQTTASNLNATIGNGSGASAVNIQDGGNSITIDATSLPLPTGAATETTLGTILADATFTSRINTLGQKAMVASTPVVLASDQSTLNVTQVERTGVSGFTGAITGVAATDVIAAPGVGLFTYVTQILVSNSHATVGTLVTIQTEDGTGLYAGYAGPAGGGFSVSFPVAIKMPVANKKLQAICGTTGANVYVSASGYTAA